MPRDLPLLAIAAGADSIDTTPTIIGLGANTDADSHAVGIQHDALLYKLRVILRNMANEGPLPAEVTWYLTSDAAGDFAITPPITQTITPGIGDNTNGAINAAIDSSEKENDVQDADEVVYLVISLDAGSADATALIFHTP